MFPGHYRPGKKQGCNGRGIFQHEKEQKVEIKTLLTIGENRQEKKETKVKEEYILTFSLSVWNLEE